MFVIWDTERINNTKIYMLGYIITDDDFNVVEQNIIIDDSIDLSKRNTPKVKKAELFNQSIVCKDFDAFINQLRGKIIETENVSVCFGKEEFESLNDQLKLHNKEPILGTYYDVKDLAEHFDVGENKKCNHLGFFAEKFQFEHIPHNPLSDSMLTLLLFKHIRENYMKHFEDDFLVQIPNKKKVLDSNVVKMTKLERL